MTDSNTKPESCGSCTLCCKVMSVVGVTRKDEWCKHCKPGKGCAIYDARPAPCQEWSCLWLHTQSEPDPDHRLAPSLRPDRCNVVLDISESGEALVAHLDPGYPDAWKEGDIGAFIEHVAGTRPVIVIKSGGKRTMYGPPRLIREYISRLKAQGLDPNNESIQGTNDQ